MQDDEDPDPQDAHDRLDFGDHGRGRADNHLHILLPALQRRLQLAPDGSIIDLVARCALLLLFQLLAADPEPRAALGLRQGANGRFRVVARRHHEFRRREGILPSPVDESCSGLLRFLLCLSHGCCDHIAEILRPGLIAMRGRFVRVEVPQLARGR